MAVSPDGQQCGRYADHEGDHTTLIASEFLPATRGACAARFPVGGESCELPADHDGAHRGRSQFGPTAGARMTWGDPPTPTPAVADALARAERGDFVAVPAPLDEHALTIIGDAASQATTDAHRLTEKAHDDDPDPSVADLRGIVDTLAAHIFALSDVLGMVVEDRRALAGQLARAEGRASEADEYAIALQRLCEWAAALMRGESREMPAGSLDASPHLARLLADAASALDAARARLAAAERVGEVAEEAVARVRELASMAPNAASVMGLDAILADYDAAGAALRARGEPAGEARQPVCECGSMWLALDGDGENDRLVCARCNREFAAFATPVDRAALPARPSTPAAEGEPNG